MCYDMSYPALVYIKNKINLMEKNKYEDSENQIQISAEA